MGMAHDPSQAPHQPEFEEGITTAMAEYGEGSTEHAYVAEGERARTEQMLGALRDDAVAGESEAVAGFKPTVDLMAECVAMVLMGREWKPTGRMPNEWDAGPGGARLRLTWVTGEVTATFLRAGWRSKATYQRALDTVRVRVRGVEDLVWLDEALTLIALGEEAGAAGARVAAAGGAGQGLDATVPGHDGGALESARPVGPMPGAVGGQLPAPGSTELPVMPVLDHVGWDAEGGSAVDSGMLPSRTYGDDAGLDLHTVGRHRIPHGEWYDLPCGIAVQIPPHCWGMIIGRSSSLKKRGLLVQISVIDPGFRGELFVQVLNVRPKKDKAGFQVDEADLVATVADKERIGQLILVPNVTPMFTPVWAARLGLSQRGESGFGSTGS